MIAPHTRAWSMAWRLDSKLLRRVCLPYSSVGFFSVMAPSLVYGLIEGLQVVPKHGVYDE